MCATYMHKRIATKNIFKNGYKKLIFKNRTLEIKNDFHMNNSKKCMRKLRWNFHYEKFWSLKKSEKFRAKYHENPANFLLIASICDFPWSDGKCFFWKIMIFSITRLAFNFWDNANQLFPRQSETGS